MNEIQKRIQQILSQAMDADALHAAEEKVEAIRREIEALLAQQRGRTADVETKVYTDQPILRTAANLPPPAPAVYRQARRIAASPEAWRQPKAWLFCKQGDLLADLEDDCPYPEPFTAYYPDYQSMTDRQLRGYITWRTKLRRGDAVENGHSYAYVYLYELLNGIGVASPESGLAKLRQFRTSYPYIDDNMAKHLYAWERDYVLYYALPVEELPAPPEDPFLQDYLVLQTAAEQSVHALAESLNRLSGYHFMQSKLYKLHPEDVEAALCAVFAAAQKTYESHRKNGLLPSLFGTISEMPCRMFDTALFYEKGHPGGDREILHGPQDRYVCRNGLWRRTAYVGSRKPSGELGQMLRYADALMREHLAVQPGIQKPALSKYIEKMLQDTIDGYFEEKRRLARPVIRVDLSLLGSIRAAADETRDRLLVEEEETGYTIPLLAAAEPRPVVAAEPRPVAVAEPRPVVVAEPEPVVAMETGMPVSAPEPPKVPATPAIEPSALPGADYGLTEAERHLLCCLLQNQPYAAWLRQSGQMESVLVDGINEKLFEPFGDTPLVYEGDQPVVLEDYAEELKGMFAL